MSRTKQTAILVTLSILAIVFLFAPRVRQNEKIDGIIGSLYEEGLIRSVGTRYEGVYQAKDAAGASATITAGAYETKSRSAVYEIMESLKKQAEDQNITLPRGFENDVAILEANESYESRFETLTEESTKK
jgi:hypothetical protein